MSDTITIVGVIGTDPEKKTWNGTTITTFRVASKDRRFDRTAKGQKLHMQSLAALRHFDFNAAGAYAYEQAIETIRLLHLPAYDVEQQFRRAVFNILARNQDDHVKNIAFLMNQQGEWRLSPAFDVSYSYNPAGSWTSQHQMSLNGKRDHFELADLVAFGTFCDLKRTIASEIIGQVHDAVLGWPDRAENAGVPEAMARGIQAALRLGVCMKSPNARMTGSG